MGPLSPPKSGAVYFDTVAFIYSVEKIEPYDAVLNAFWEAAKAGRIDIISSELVILETLVKPIRERDALMENVYRALLLDSQEVRLLPVSQQVLERAARLRSEIRLRTPDAIHVATALEAGAALFVTNDVEIERVPGLPVALLSSPNAPR